MNQWDFFHKENSKRKKAGSTGIEPAIFCVTGRRDNRTSLRPRFAYQKKQVGLGGLEPPTSPLSGVRSNHLSYKPITN